MEAARLLRDREEARDKEIKEIMDRQYQAELEGTRVDIMKRGEAMSLLRRLQNERIEAFREEDILRAQEAGKVAPEQVLQTQKLAQEVLRVKNKEVQDQKRQQVLRDGAIELKQLQAQLRSTYVAKTAQVQLRETWARQENAKCRVKQQARMINDWYLDDAFQQKMAREALERKLQFKRDIQDQLVNNYLLRQQKAEEDQRERKVVEQVSQVLYEENLRLEKERIDKIAHTLAERDAFFGSMEIWKCKEKEAILDEYNRQMQIIADKSAEEKKQFETKTSNEAAKEAMIERIARKMLDDECKRRDREYIISELFCEEQKNEIATKLKNEELDRERTKKELLEDMERQKKSIAERRAHTAAVDAAFARYIAQEFRIAEQKDREKDEARRRKAVKHGKELKAAIEEERVVYAKEILRNQVLQKQDEELEQKLLQEVSETRSKMLYEHAPNLEGFLKSGTIRPEDYEYMKAQTCKPKP